MKHVIGFSKCLKVVLAFSLVFFAGILSAQNTSISDFAVFGGSKSNTTDNGTRKVEIGSNNSITGGAVGSYYFIKTTGKVNFAGPLNSWGKIQLDDYNSVDGIISAANLSSYSGNIFSTGKNGEFKQNIDVNGNSYVGSFSNVFGKVTHPAGTTYNGPVPNGGNVTGTPTLPGLPQMPAITVFPKAGTESITNNRTISPGAFDRLALSGSKTVCFSGTGIYVFNSIKNFGSTNSIDFDFKNDKTGVIKVYIYGDVDLGKIAVNIKNGGDASRIIAEVHGSGSTCKDNKSSWIMDNGLLYNLESTWIGTVWAPYGDITLGSGKGKSIVTGALISNTGVYLESNVTVNFAPFSSCTKPDVNAGPDRDLNILEPIKLEGSSSTPGVIFDWQAIKGGKVISGGNTATATVSLAGTYVLTATVGEGCFSTDTVIVSGKIQDIIGPELKSLSTSNDRTSSLAKSIYIIQNDSVFIEVIAVLGQYNNLLALLQTPEYGMTDLMTNGESQLIITGKFPIANLLKLDMLPNLINFCRPVYPPVINSGVAQSAGDSAMRTNYVRKGFKVQGEGVRIGVLSDSYNSLPGNPAYNDVINGDLPGAGNPQNTNPVKVLKEYPYGQRTDEGRAMLQIIHDVAPKADLSFRTGSISAGDFAVGIQELAADNCNVIVDDITYITEPFFRKGVVETAISDVTSKGVTYITSAGNFGNKSYGSLFKAVDVPEGYSGKAHDFGGGDILQSDSVKGTELNPGIYTIVLQWEDDIYSLNGSGTSNDLDIYLADENGNPIVGYNRDNTGGDPFEILPFSVTGNTVVNIMIINRSPNPTPGLRFKYVVFRGDLKINEYSSESSTIVGHSNSADAITVGAARYNRTPAFGTSTPVLESFSSVGGTMTTGGMRSQKPDLIGPDGVNTTVDFKNVDLEGDGLPNFFGTSAAAPHVAGAVALLLQVEKKYNNKVVSPADVKSILTGNAIDMDIPGFDFNTGHGFIQADASLRTLANPTPEIAGLEFPDPNLKPGEQPMDIIINGNYLSPDTKIVFGTDTLSATINGTNQAVATLPIFYANKLIHAYTPPKTSSELDGGISNSISIDGIPKKNITVIADNKTRLYGTEMPAFTATVLVNGDSLKYTTLSIADLGLTDILYSTPATETSNVGILYIRPSRIFDATNEDDALFLEKYNYGFTDGALTTAKLPIKIKARDTTLVYGQKAGDFKFNYSIDPKAVFTNESQFINSVKTQHEDQLADDVVGLVNGQAVMIVNGQAVPIVNGQAVTIVNGQAVTIVNGQAVPIVNAQAVTIVNGQAVMIVNNLTESQVNNISFMASNSSLQEARQLNSSTIVNGQNVEQKTNVVDITQESVLRFIENSAQAPLLSSINNVSAKGLIDIETLNNGQAVMIVNGQAVMIVNGQAVTIVNGQAVTIVNGQAVMIVNGQAVPIVNRQNTTAVILNGSDIGNSANEYKALNIITGLDAGNQLIIPAALSNNNFDISYEVGKLTILPAPLTIKAMDSSKIYGTELTLDNKRYKITEGSLMYNDSLMNVPVQSEGVAANALPGNYAIKIGPAAAGEGTNLSNYKITYQEGNLSIGKATLIVKANDATKVYGDANPDFSASFTNSVDGQAVESSTVTGMPAFVTPANSNSDVGNYDINVSVGSLSSALFDFEFKKGQLQITPAPLVVKADDKVIFRYDQLPQFTGSIQYLRAGDLANVQYSLDPSYDGQPGVYSIIPKLTSFAQEKNYAVTYQNGKLYVNPKCGDAQNLEAKLSCVEKVSPGKYIAHFYCINNNATALKIPRGIGNFIFSFGSFDASQIPEVFEPGITKFDVAFDGYPMTWFISSYDRCWYRPDIACASYVSPTCAIDLLNNDLSSYQKNFGPDKALATIVNSTVNHKVQLGEKERPENRIQGELTVFPNPVQNNAIIYYSSENINEKGASLVDVSGKTHPIKLIRQITPHSFEIDISNFKRGFYFLKVKVKDGYKSITLVKG
ncbi:MAG: MBG domain-containing protein [Ginsengibacter sp.]